MRNFEDIIKQKTEQFDVPYNEAHWEKVAQQLDALKVARIKKNTLVAAGVIAIASVVGVWMYQSKTSDLAKTPASTSQTVSADPSFTNKEIENPAHPSSNHLKQSASANTAESPNTTPSQNKPPVEKVTTITPNQEALIANNNPSPVEPNIPLSTKKQVEDLSLNAEFIVYNNKVCLGEQVSFEAVEKKKVTYVWDFGDGTSSTLQNPVHYYLTAGNYTVTLTVKDRTSGQSVSHEMKQAATIMPLPAGDFTYVEQAEKYDANKLKYPYTLFSVKGEEMASYAWSFGNGQTSKHPSPKVIYNEKGTFKTSLTITNSFGCNRIISKPVTIQHPFDLFAPNAFSPNLDGDNDVFIPKGLLTWDVQFEMIIKNKSGDVVYKTINQNEGWNGKLNNSGVVLDAGIYFWQVITYDAEGSTHQHVGKINLIK